MEYKMKENCQVSNNLLDFKTFDIKCPSDLGRKIENNYHFFSQLLGFWLMENITSK